MQPIDEQIEVSLTKHYRHNFPIARVFHRLKDPGLIPSSQQIHEQQKAPVVIETIYSKRGIVLFAVQSTR
ncbi:hypothetical protein LDG_7982 [Legionella drancourtii LLAP12]|uniref:Uncharacterized protein n=1 Tax=Legionella drancourtii LLAP12 TaxID=658187 RepID=G9ERR4_9GAMM|nr:hypothetical protein LDG_7982 [Legionella drancourtii LLAP12]